MDKYGLPRSHFHRYLQFWSFVASQAACFSHLPPTSYLDSLFFGTNLKQIIGKMYKLLNLHNPVTLDALEGKVGGRLR